MGSLGSSKGPPGPGSGQSKSSLTKAGKLFDLPKFENGFWNPPPKMEIPEAPLLLVAGYDEEILDEALSALKFFFITDQ